MSENGHARPVGSDGSRIQSRKQEPENKNGVLDILRKVLIWCYKDYESIDRLSNRGIWIISN